MKDDELSLLYNIAVMYYEEKLTQDEISKKTGISRPQISRLLAKAISVGIVEIKVIPPKSTSALAESLKEKLGLKKVYVAPAVNNTGDRRQDIIDDISEYGASVIGGILYGKENIGVGWGETVYNTVLRMEGASSYNIHPTVAPLVGSLGYHEAHYQVNIIAGLLSNKIKGRPLFYNISDRIVEETEEADRRMGQYKELNEVWNRLDAAIIGLGPYPTVHFPEGSVTDTWMEELAKSEPKGDIIGRFFNEYGYIHDSKSRFLGIPEEALKKTETVICLCGGSEKTEAIITASKLGYISHLITDAKTAEEIVNYLK